MCGDFNLTKSKKKKEDQEGNKIEGNEIRDDVNYEGLDFLKEKVFPDWQIKKKRGEMNILLNNQIHKGGEDVTEMDGMAIFKFNCSETESKQDDSRATVNPQERSKAVDGESKVIEIQGDKTKN